MGLIEAIHGGYVYQRRVRVLADHLARLLRDDTHVLDIGCGDGLIASRIMQNHPSIRIDAIDIHVRERTHLPVSRFDGRHIPLADDSVDVSMLVDVLHHTEEPLALLGEASRVARHAVLLKDHTRDGWLAGPTLRYMDRVGNARFGVPLANTFWSAARWREVFAGLDLPVLVWEDRLAIYPPPLDWFFGRELHVLTRLDSSHSGH